MAFCCLAVPSRQIVLTIFSMSKINLTFLSGVGEVTGSNFLLESDSARILIDCGLIQGSAFCEQENRVAFPYNPSLIDFLLVTHAHLDHIGRIPKLVKDGFKGTIYSTYQTRELAEVMFNDALSIPESETRKEGTLPLYERQDIEKALSLWKEVSYHEEISLKENLSFYLKDAGHILGSAIIEIRRNGKKIIFTGDLGNSPAPLLKDTEEITDADYLIIESVYGNKNHEPKDERDAHFAKVLNNTIARNGTVVIPAFSLERTQNILYTLNNLVEEKKIPSVPVFVDSPLAIKVTEIYKHRSADFKESVRREISEGDDIFNFPKLSFTVSTEESNTIHKANNPKIILAGSGMSAGGRVTKHEKEFLPDKKSTILLVGYQSVGTLGRALEEGTKHVYINGEQVSVKAQIVNIRGFSSHKDSDGLISFVEKTASKVKKVFVVMGEPKASLFLVQRLRDYVGVEAIYPKLRKPYLLEF